MLLNMAPSVGETGVALRVGQSFIISVKMQGSYTSMLLWEHLLNNAFYAEFLCDGEGVFGDCLRDLDEGDWPWDSYSNSQVCICRLFHT